jgi:hypothetical protein
VNDFPYSPDVVRYVFKNAAGATVRQFRTNDRAFYLRTLEHDRRIHGDLTVHSEPSESPMQPDFGRPS